MTIHRQKRKSLALGLGFLGAIVLFGSLVSANTLNRFELNDGSVIQGKILSYSRGVYQINSDVLGAITLPENKIKAIHPAGNPGSRSSAEKEPSSPTPDAQRMDQLQKEMMNDPETVQLIQQLQDDPSVQEILQDKELMEAIQQGNLNKVATDPKIQELMKDETVEKIIEKNR